MDFGADLIAHGIRLVLKDGWRGHARESDGVFITHVGTDTKIHARGWRAVVDPRSELMHQNWGVPPFDIIERMTGARRTVGGTFSTSDGKLVREWYVVEGHRGANATIWFDRVPYSLTPFERLVDSIELR